MKFDDLVESILRPSKFGLAKGELGAKQQAQATADQQAAEQDAARAAGEQQAQAALGQQEQIQAEMQRLMAAKEQQLNSEFATLAQTDPNKFAAVKQARIASYQKNLARKFGMS